MSEDDVLYYRRRADQERAAAQRAADAAAARIHEQLAATYAALVTETSQDAPEAAGVNTPVEALPGDRPPA
jgi:hypothetical protein